MKIPGYAIEPTCRWYSLGPCSIGGIRAIVFDCDGNYVGPACSQHLETAMLAAQRDESELS